MYHNLFMCLSIDEHLGCFCFLFILNNAAMNICVHTFWGHIFSILLGVYFRMDIQGCMVTVYLIFWGPAKLFPKVAACSNYEMSYISKTLCG